MVFDPLPQYYETLKFPEDSLPNGDQLKILLANAHLFSIEKNITQALQKTDNIMKSTMPFDDIIIVPENLEFENQKVVSIAIINLSVNSVLLKKNFHKAYCLTIKNNEGIITAPMFLFDKESQESSNSISFINDVSKGNFGNYVSNRQMRLTQKFCISFLEFLNNPEVEIIEHKPLEDHNQKRIMQNKTPLPTRANIRITGKLKVYLENFRRQAQQYGYSHRFWVRGHFMHWRSDRYTNMQGKKTWVLPYIKGEGILINKTYQVVKQKNAD